MNNMEKEAQIKVYYDGLCKVCSLEMDHYKKQPQANLIQFIDICQKSFDAKAEGLDPFEVHKVMHVRRQDGTLATKVDAFIEIWKTLPRYKSWAKWAESPFIRKNLDLGYIIFAALRPWLPRRKASEDCSESPYCEVHRHG